ncbi:unnamed protein product, partial [Rotaria sp. Silwood2]
TGSLPLIRVIEGQTAIIQIPAADWDRTDDIRCRWASSSGPAGNECGDILNSSFIRLIYTYQPALGACSVIPAVIGDRPNRACIGVLPGVQHVERIVAAVYCTGDYITEFITISPLYMKKTTITAVSGTTNQWYITLTWTPTTDQIGPQVFCAAPIDQNELTGSQHCINFVVGYLAPNLITPTLVQGRRLISFLNHLTYFCYFQDQLHH